MSLNHGSLFSGGGGFDLAAEMMGWNNIFHCEIDPFCNRILNYYWPKAYHFHDIQKFDATSFKGKIDILTGGFPCQPFSTAGKRKGTADSRHLWPQMLRIIREIKPEWVVGENVYGIVSWNEGVVFEQVHSDLEREGYEVQTFVLPACGVNAPHRRYRAWFIAHAIARTGCSQEPATDGKQETAHSSQWKDIHHQPGRPGGSQLASYTDNSGLERRKKTGNTTESREKQIKQFARLCKSGYWRCWPTQSPVCSRDDGLPAKLDGITFSKWRRESIRMYGNAIVPQVALQIFKAIQEYHNVNGR